jgi:hypothetical protein
MKTNIASILFLIIQLPLFAQNWQPMGTRSNSLANSSVSISDVWAYHNNPGALGNLKKTSFGLSYENRYLLKETQFQGFCFASPIKIGVISVGGQFYGSDNLKTYRAGFGYSLKLTDYLAAGVQLNSLGIRLPSYYGSKNSITAEIGIQAFINENWSIGFSTFNITNSKLASFQNEQFSTVMRLGTAYKISKNVQLFLQADKSILHKIQFKTAFEYNSKEKFFFRGGISTQPLFISFGFGYHFKKMDLNLGSSYQQILGWCPSFTLNFELNKKQNESN